MENFTPAASLIGGIMIGGAAALFMLATGRICGASGIYGGLLHFKRGDSFWRLMFVSGLLVGGYFSVQFFPDADDIRMNISLSSVILAGLLVGLGVRMGSGCTSGHGVCGVGRLAPRSLVATAIFVGAGMLVATFVSPYLA